MIKPEIETRWPLTPQVNVAVDRQLRFLEFRTPRQLHVGAARNRLKIEISSSFFIESKVAQVNAGIDHRRIQIAAALRSKIHVAFHRHMRLLQLRDMEQIESRTAEVKVEVSGVGTIRSSARDTRLLVAQLNILELKFSRCVTKIGFQERDGLPVYDALPKFKLSVCMRIHPRAGGREHHIGLPADWVVVTKQRLQIGKAFIPHLNTSRKRAGLT